MIIQLRPEEVVEWFVCFHVNPRRTLFDRCIPGRFKHVRAFAKSNGCDCWVFFDPAWSGTSITLAPSGARADEIIGQYARDAAVLRIDRQSRPATHRSKFGWCVPSIRDLLNLPGGALLPETLWRDCRKAGAKVILDAARGPGPDTRPGDCSTASAGDGERHEAN